MATLIGSGGHAQDISDTMFFGTRYDHHDLYVEHHDEVVVAINHSQTRAKVAADLGLRDMAWVHPNAHVTRSCSYGYGTHINYGVTMTRTHMGHHCTIAPGVTICGDVTIGDRVFVGAGAVITNLLTIGDDAVVGAGAIVLHDVPAGVTVVGNPARIVKGRT